MASAQVWPCWRSVFQALPETQLAGNPYYISAWYAASWSSYQPVPSLATANSSLPLAPQLEANLASFTSRTCLSAVLIWVACVSRSTVDLRRSQLSTDTVGTAIQFLSHPNELIATRTNR